MTYFQMGDDHLAKLEDAGLSNDAILLEVQAFNQCAKTASNGYIRTRLSKLIEATDTSALAGELVAAGFWEVTDDGYYVVNYLSHNLSGEDQELARAGARERQQRSRKHKLGDHSMCIRGNYCKLGEIEPANRSSNTDVTRDATRDITPIQDNAMQGNKSRSISIDSKDGATPDAPKGALGFAPNGGLVISDGLQNWPHPHIRVDSMACVICGMEHARGRHFPTNKTQEVSYVVDYLNKAKIGTEISYEIEPSSNLICIVLGAFFENVKVEFRCGSQDLDAKLTEDLVVTSLRTLLPTPPSFSEWPNNTRNLWIQPVRALAESIFSTDCRFTLRSADPSDQTSKITGCELFIRDPEGIGYCMEPIEEIMNAIQELSDTKPEQPDVNLPAPTEANTETN